MGYMIREKVENHTVDHIYSARKRHDRPSEARAAEDKKPGMGTIR